MCCVQLKEESHKQPSVPHRVQPSLHPWQGWGNGNLQRAGWDCKEFSKSWPNSGKKKSKLLS